MNVARKPLSGLRGLYRRWRARPRRLSEAQWSRNLQTFAYAQKLSKTEQQELRALCARFLSAKSFEGAAGLSITDDMRARIAVHACVPILNLGFDCYNGWTSVVIYPGDFRVHDEYMDEYGVVHQAVQDLCGQSLSPGPMVLSWEALMEEDAAPADQNLVIHECAHKLDILNGAANGFPPLRADMKWDDWTRDWSASYDRLCARLNTGENSRLDAYAAEDAAEFFAVMSETFFTAPHIVYEDFPAVYKQLQAYYRQDPYLRMHP